MRQMPTYKEQGARNGDYYATETSTEYLDKHATEWSPPLGPDLHLHLVYTTAHTVHWRVVTLASSACKVAGRCHRVSVLPTKVVEQLDPTLSVDEVRTGDFSFDLNYELPPAAQDVASPSRTTRPREGHSGR